MADLAALAAARKKANDRYAKALRSEAQAVIDDLTGRRKDQGLTQQEIADAAGVSRAQIANAESATNGGVLSMEALLGYARAVGCTIVIRTQSDGVADDFRPGGRP